MDIVKVVPSGYCKGVIRAINMVKKAINDYPDKQIYILGMLVHNRYVVEAFNLFNVVTLSEKEKTKSQWIDEIDDGVVVFTAHGVDPKLIEKAKNKGLIVVDATCLDVIKNAQLCTDYLSKGYHIIYIGKKNHPESEAVLALDEKIHLVTDEKSIEDLDLNTDLILVTNQTTMSISDISIQIDLIKKKYPQSIIAEEICSATRSRQNAILNLQGYDCLIVVGDPYSNNTTQLAHIGNLAGIEKVIKVENANQLKDYDLTDVKNIAVTSGASTPALLTNQLINYLKTKDPKYLDIDLKEILNH